jgi:hypothetical protein
MSCHAIQAHTEALHATDHPMNEGDDPPEAWRWCYVDEAMLDPSDRKIPQSNPNPAPRMTIDKHWTTGAPGSTATPCPS